MGVDIEALTRDLPNERRQAIRHAYVRQAKHDTTAFLFCFFLGMVGAHRFYLGRPAAGLARWILPLLALLVAGLGFALNSSPIAIVVVLALLLFFALAWEIVDLFGIDAAVDAYNEALARRLLASPGGGLPPPPAPPAAPASGVAAGTLGMLTAEDVAWAREFALDVPTGMAPAPSAAPLATTISPSPLAATATYEAPAPVTTERTTERTAETTNAPVAEPSAPPIWPVDAALVGAVAGVSALAAREAGNQPEEHAAPATPTGAPETPTTPATTPAEDLATAPLPPHVWQPAGGEDTAPVPPVVLPAAPPFWPAEGQPTIVHPLAVDPTDQVAPDAPRQTLRGDADVSHVHLPAQHPNFTAPSHAPAAGFVPQYLAQAPAPAESPSIHAPSQDATDASGVHMLPDALRGDGVPSAFVAIPSASPSAEIMPPAPAADLPTRPSVSGPISPEEALLMLVPDESQPQGDAAPTPDEAQPWPAPAPRPESPSHPVPPEAFVPPSVANPHSASPWGTVPPPAPRVWAEPDDPNETTAPMSPLDVTPPQDAPAEDNLAELALGLAGGAAVGGVAAEALSRAHEQQPAAEAQSAPEMATQPEPPTQPLPPPAPATTETPAAAPVPAPTSGGLKKVRVVRRVVVDGKVVSERVVEEIVPIETDAAAAAAALDDKLGHLTAEQAAQLANLPPEAQLEMRRKMQIERAPNTGNTGTTGNNGGSGNGNPPTSGGEQ